MKPNIKKLLISLALFLLFVPVAFLQILHERASWLMWVWAPAGFLLICYNIWLLRGLPRKQAVWQIAVTVFYMQLYLLSFANIFHLGLLNFLVMLIGGIVLLGCILYAAALERKGERA